LLLVLICAAAAAFFFNGCARPWTAPFAAPTIQDRAERTANVPDEAPLQAGSVQPAAAAQQGASSDPTSAQLAGVLDQLQQIRAIDPGAESTLMEQLRRTPAESWPLVAEQFRASLAYREQLASTPSRSADSAGYTEPGESAYARARQRYASRSLQPPTEDASDAASSVPKPSTHESTQHAADDHFIPIVATTPDASDSTDTAHGASGTTVPEVVQATLNASEPQSVSWPASSTTGSEALTSVDTVTAETWQQLVAKAADDLGRRVASSPTTTAEVHQHVTLRLLRLLSGDTEGALEPIPGISPTEQDYWSKQLFALAAYLDHHSQPDENRRAAASVIHLDEAVSHLRELGSLSVRNLSFCKNVYGYGAIEPYEADVFSPGQQVSLYVEVENYHSKSTDKGFCTSLGSTYELLNDKGERVGGGEIPDVNDCCRSRRRDFHIQYGIALPKELTQGRYQLQLVIKDRQSDKRGQATVAFEIKGATPLPAVTSSASPAPTAAK
jgi:hypothetical protein